jgi:iron complex outermembrane recepter protein
MSRLHAARLRVLSAGASFAVLAAAAGPAAAQQASAAATEATRAETIVVTARKREENLQEVPLSISAFTAEVIAERGLTSIADIATQTPGFSFRSGFGRTFDRPVIRGMSTIQGASNAAFFIDGVFVSGSIAGYGLDNIERVEVIKGPQSALFGRSTFSGAVNYITRRPADDRLSGKINATGGEDGLLDVSGYINGPLFNSDKVLFELNARGYAFDGQYTNELDPGQNLGSEQSTSYGWGLFIRPIEGLEIVYRGNRVRDKDGAPALALIGRRIGQAFPLPPGQLQTGGINCFQPQLTGALNAGRPVTSTRARGYWCGEVPIPQRFAMNTGEYRAAGFPYAIDRKIERNTFKATYDLADWTFSGFYATNRLEIASYTDQDYSDLRANGFETYSSGGSIDQSYDLRVATPGDWRIRGQVGFYRYKEKELANGFSGSLRITPPGGANRQFNIGDDRTLLPRNAVAPGQVLNEAWYAQVEVDITDKLKASAEVRSQTDTVSTSGVNTFTFSGQTFRRSLNVSSEFESVLPRYTLDYQLTPDIMLYGVAAQGNKPGGVNTGVYGAVYTDEQVRLFESLGLATFKEEEIWSYEIGAKTAWFDDRLVLNASAYYIDWTNQQLTTTIAVPGTGRRDGVLGSLAFNTNVGQSEVQGVEIEAVGRPVDWLELRFGYALADTNIINFVNDDQADLYITAADIAALNAAAPPPLPTATQAQRDAALNARIAAANALIALRGNARGNDLPRSPKHQIQLGAAVFQDLANGWRVTYRADYSWEAKRFIQVDNLGWSQPLNLLNLRASVEAGKVTATFFVNNALDDDTPVDVLRSIDTAQTISRPQLRSFGLEPGTGFLRDFVVTMPRKRNAGVTVSVAF